VYFQIIYNALREPMRRALEALIMERQTQGPTPFPPFFQKIVDEAEIKAELKGELRGELRGELKGELKGKRDTLLRLVARVGIALTEDDRTRIQTCTDASTLDRWVDNVLGAKTAAEVLA